jgi:hypothetical protein
MIRRRPADSSSPGKLDPVSLEPDYNATVRIERIPG